jgi:hypothetical protein
MKTKSVIIRKAVSVVALLYIALSCVHEPMVVPDDPNNPGGNGEPVNTDTVTFNVNTASCEPGTVYFNTQVLPIFISNCAISGCHDAASAKDGIVLNNYQNIMKKIKPGNLNDSENYKVLVETDTKELMPRKPGTEQGYSLPADQITVIRNWILQGAKNNYCDACDDSNFNFNDRISAIFQLNCATSPACHGSGSSYGVFTNYENVKAYVNTDKIQRRVIVYKDMPPAAPLADCDRLLIKKWIDAGAQNN